MRRRGPVLLAVAVLAGGGACAAPLPAGKAWTVDTTPWQGSPECSEQPCALDAYPTRDFTPIGAVPDALEQGAEVQVHCFVPTPAPQQDPRGRDAYRWYLVTVDDTLLWAPDLALTAQPDLRGDEGLAAGVPLCHSGVPGR
jgi:hypothetical protein